MRASVISVTSRNEEAGIYPSMYDVTGSDVIG